MTSCAGAPNAKMGPGPGQGYIPNFSGPPTGCATRPSTSNGLMGMPMGMQEQGQMYATDLMPGGREMMVQGGQLVSRNGSRMNADEFPIDPRFLYGSRGQMIHVFTSQLANDAAAAVRQCSVSSIIDYHMSQPEVQRHVTFNLNSTGLPKSNYMPHTMMPVGKGGPVPMPQGGNIISMNRFPNGGSHVTMPSSNAANGGPQGFPSCSVNRTSSMSSEPPRSPAGGVPTSCASVPPPRPASQDKFGGGGSKPATPRSAQVPFPSPRSVGGIPSGSQCPLQSPSSVPPMKTNEMQPSPMMLNQPMTPNPSGPPRTPSAQTPTISSSTCALVDPSSTVKLEPVQDLIQQPYSNISAGNPDGGPYSVKTEQVKSPYTPMSCPPSAGSAAAKDPLAILQAMVEVAPAAKQPRLSAGNEEYIGQGHSSMAMMNHGNRYPPGPSGRPSQTLNGFVGGDPNIASQVGSLSMQQQIANKSKTEKMRKLQALSEQLGVPDADWSSGGEMQSNAPPPYTQAVGVPMVGSGPPHNGAIGPGMMMPRPNMMRGAMPPGDMYPGPIGPNGEPMTQQEAMRFRQMMNAGGMQGGGPGGEMMMHPGMAMGPMNPYGHEIPPHMLRGGQRPYMMQPGPNGYMQPGFPGPPGAMMHPQQSLPSNVPAAPASKRKRKSKKAEANANAAASTAAMQLPPGPAQSIPPGAMMQRNGMMPAGMPMRIPMGAIPGQSGMGHGGGNMPPGAYVQPSGMNQPGQPGSMDDMNPFGGMHLQTMHMGPGMVPSAGPSGPMRSQMLPGGARLPSHMMTQQGPPVQSITPVSQSPALGASEFSGAVDFGSDFSAELLERISDGDFPNTDVSDFEFMNLQPSISSASQAYMPPQSAANVTSKSMNNFNAKSGFEMNMGRVATQQKGSAPSSNPMGGPPNMPAPGSGPSGDGGPNYTTEGSHGGDSSNIYLYTQMTIQQVNVQNVAHPYGPVSMTFNQVQSQNSNVNQQNTYPASSGAAPGPRMCPDGPVPMGAGPGPYGYPPGSAASSMPNRPQGVNKEQPISDMNLENKVPSKLHSYYPENTGQVPHTSSSLGSCVSQKSNSRHGSSQDFMAMQASNISNSNPMMVSSVAGGIPHSSYASDLMASIPNSDELESLLNQDDFISSSAAGGGATSQTFIQHQHQSLNIHQHSANFMYQQNNHLNQHPGGAHGNFNPSFGGMHPSGPGAVRYPGGPMVGMPPVVSSSPGPMHTRPTGPYHGK